MYLIKSINSVLVFKLTIKRICKTGNRILNKYILLYQKNKNQSNVLVYNVYGKVIEKPSKHQQNVQSSVNAHIQWVVQSLRSTISSLPSSFSLSCGQ